MADRYKPGYRRNARLRGTGQMSDNRHAWVKTAIGQFVVMLQPPDDEDTEIGTSVRLYHPRPGARPLSLNLTALTEEELNAIRDFCTLLYDLALPVVQQRDKVAQHALEQGDDSHVRVYRQAPQFIVRPRPEREHAEGVPIGPDGADEVEPDPDPDGDVRGDGDGVAERPPSDRGPEDDSTPDQ